MYSYDRREVTAAASKRAAKYDEAFQTIVKAVDALEEGAKKIPAALDALNDLDHHIKSDPDVQNMEGLQKYAPEQQVEYLMDKLKTVEKSIESLISQYDDSNRSFLRMKLR